MTARSANLWAPIVTNSRSEWVVWTCVRKTQCEARRAYLDSVDPAYQKEHLARVRFGRVDVIERGPE